MLRAAVLHPFLRGIRRFSTSGHPAALGACYVASWQLPRPDSHWQANDDFSGHTTRLFGIDWIGGFIIYAQSVAQSAVAEMG